MVLSRYSGIVELEVNKNIFKKKNRMYTVHENGIQHFLLWMTLFIYFDVIKNLFVILCVS